VTSPQILAAGQDLMDEIDIETLDHLTMSQALRYRDGLLLSLLAFMPLRRKNVAALALDRHLVSEGENRFICIPAEETKTRTAIEFAIPSLLLAYLDRYLRLGRAPLQ
jgi:integrase/recombinase XerD